MATKKTKNTSYYAIICNEKFGIYAGFVEEFDVVTRTVKATEVRHVSRWYGKTGGITSLAAHGLCGSSSGDSRIGAPAPGTSTLTGIVNVFPCSEEAHATIVAAKQS